MRKLPTLAAVGLLCAGAVALAQTTPLRDFLGTETLRLTLGSGSVIDVTISQVRNTRGISPVGATTTLNVSPSGTVGYLVSTGAITNLHVSLPNPADKGQVFFFTNGDTASVTNANVGVQSGSQTQTMAATYAGQGVGPSSSVGWIYDFTASAWRRIQ